MKEPTLLQMDTVPVADVEVRDRLRPVTEAGVESLIASVTELGVMKDAIHVRKRKDGRLVLIAGLHRLEMAKRLSWADIPAKVWADVTDDWARMMEVDDNLAGAEMNALDTAVFLARRKEVYERLHPEAGRGGDRRSVDFQNQTDTMSVRSFATATAEKFNLSERQVFRMLAAGTALHGGDIARLRAAPKPVALADLQVIAKADPSQRHHIVAALAEGTAKSAAAARAAYVARERGDAAPVQDPVEQSFKALVSGWKRASPETQRRFVSTHWFELHALIRDIQPLDDAPKVAAE